VNALCWEVVPRGDLDAATIDGLFGVQTRVYADVRRDVFEADLAEKDEVILLRDDAGALRGFSTVRTYASMLGTAPVDVLFSGDTAIDPEAWGSAALPRAWLWTALSHARPDRPLWWLLLAGGFRTYRYLTVFFERGWPRHDREMSAEMRDFRDRLARERYGDRYADGVVRLDAGAPLQPELAVAGGLRARVDPHVAWFLAANPGYTRGDELVCLTEISPANLTRAGRRVLDGIAGCEGRGRA
jgi:hypothetical protein